MSAIFGIVNFNGDLLDKAIMLKMQNAIINWGPDQQFVYQEETVGLGQVMQYTTQESLNERFPLIDPTGNIIFVAACRIDNREELINKIVPIQNRYNKVFTDSELMFEAYQKYGKECVHHLIGDWAFAVWHKKEKELFVARDQCGITGLYFHLGYNKLIFSSDIKSVIYLMDDKPETDEIFLAQNLLSIQQAPFSTCYSNIKHLDPAHYFSFKNNTYSCYKYWELKSENTNIAFNDWYSEYNYLLNASIKARLRDTRPLGAFYSGGLDSTISVNLLQKALAKSNRTLQVFTYIGKDQKATYADALKANIVNKENIVLNFDSSELISPLDGIKHSIENNLQPVIAPMNQFWIYSLFLKAQEKGVKTIFTGQYGNATISWPKSFGRIENISSWTEHFLNTQAADLIFSSLLKLRDIKRNYSNSYINAQFLEKNYNKIIASYNLHSPKYSNLKNGFLLNLEKTMRLNGAFLSHRSIPHQISTYDFYRDWRLLKFCYSLPQKTMMNKGKGRIIARNALKDLGIKKYIQLPEFQNFGFDKDYDKTQYLNLIEESKKNKYSKHLFDIERLESYVEQNKLNINSLNYSNKLSKTLNLLLFNNKIENLL